MRKPLLAPCRLTASTATQDLAALGLIIRQHQAEGSPSDEHRLGTVQTDSRRVVPGDLFIAYRGVHSDGHTHLGSAVSNGAVLLIGEDQAALEAYPATSWVLVKDARIAWAYLAARAYGQPQKQLTLLGVTGTNGKTSTVWMTAALLRAAGHPCLSIGTLGAYFGAEFLPLTHTTPDPDVLFALFAKALELQIKVVVMEVSSHAIAQGKVAPLTFQAAAFSSFSRDHLDYHETIEAYWNTKVRLFTEHTSPNATRIFAAGIPGIEQLGRDYPNSLAYGIDAANKPAFLAPTQLMNLTVQGMAATGSQLKASLGNRTCSGRVPYFAEHALENFAAALLLASDVVGTLVPAELWGNLPPVPGRLEIVAQAPGVSPTVVVDYAHTPDALSKTLSVLRPFCRGRLVLVFGCGGERDRGKRPLMGRIAEELADQVIITSDNPRSESSTQIILDILAGCKEPAAIGREPDREAAIARAIGTAAPHDIVLIAGKGHEATQTFAGYSVPFEDAAVARRWLSHRDATKDVSHDHLG